VRGLLSVLGLEVVGLVVLVKGVHAGGGCAGKWSVAPCGYRGIGMGPVGHGMGHCADAHAQRLYTATRAS
jgi:hypothetical protein